MASRPGIHYPTLAQLILSACGGLLGLSAAALLLVMGVMNLLSGEAASQATGMLNLAGGSAVIGMLCLPSAVYAALRLLNRPLPDWRLPANIRLLVIGLPVLWGMALGLAAVVIGKPIESLVVPIIFPVVVSAPIVWLLLLGGRGLSLGGPQRRWGAISFSLTGTLAIVLTAEILLGIILLLVFAFWLAANPDQLAWFEQFVTLAETLAPSTDLEPMVMEILQRPAVIPGILLLVAGIIPFMEELIKPLALYFLLERRLTPAQGFVGGLFCGACFAFSETIGSMGLVTDPLSWVMMAVGRSGTALLHITCTGLVGWGLASAFTERRWGVFARALLGAVALHGIWNAAAIMEGISALQTGAVWRILEIASPVVLGVLALTNLLILLKMNHHLQPKMDTPAEVMMDGTIA